MILSDATSDELGAKLASLQATAKGLRAAGQTAAAEVLEKQAYNVGQTIAAQAAGREAAAAGTAASNSAAAIAARNAATAAATVPSASPSSRTLLIGAGIVLGLGGLGFILTRKPKRT